MSDMDVVISVVSRVPKHQYDYVYMAYCFSKDLGLFNPYNIKYEILFYSKYNDQINL
jgi:hypothetical protein